MSDPTECGGGDGDVAATNVLHHVELSLSDGGGGLGHTQSTLRNALRLAEGKVQLPKAGHDVDVALADRVVLPADDDVIGEVTDALLYLLL